MSNEHTIRVADLTAGDTRQNPTKENRKALARQRAQQKLSNLSVPKQPRSMPAAKAEIAKQRELLKDHPERLAQLDELSQSLGLDSSSEDGGNQ